MYIKHATRQRLTPQRTITIDITTPFTPVSRVAIAAATLIVCLTSHLWVCIDRTLSVVGCLKGWSRRRYWMGARAREWLLVHEVRTAFSKKCLPVELVNVLVQSCCFLFRNVCAMSRVPYVWLVFSCSITNNMHEGCCRHVFNRVV